MKTNRRTFIRNAAAFGALNIIPAKVLWGEEAPSNQLTRALIGFGGIAHSENHMAFKGSRLVGLCDPDAAHVAEGLSVAEANGWGKVKAYANFLKLLEDPGVDIVHICTPPHWHGVMSVMAARAGKDIWCEKPMTRTVGEGKRVAEYVKEKGRIFRINTWFRFKDRFYGFGTPVKPIRQVVENGLLGKGPIKCVFGAGQGFNEWLERRLAKREWKVCAVHLEPETADAAIALAVKCGAPYVTVSASAPDIAGLQSRCAAKGVTLLLENGGESADELARKLKSLPGVGLAFDPANLILNAKGDPVAAVKTLAPHIRHVRLRDAVSPKASGEAGVEVPWGEGELKAEELFAALDAAGYKGVFAFARLSGEKRVRDLQQAVNWYHTH